MLKVGAGNYLGVPLLGKMEQATSEFLKCNISFTMLGAHCL
jgi:hypothetical protein